MPISKLGALLDALDQPSSVTGEVLVELILDAPGVDIPDDLAAGAVSPAGTLTLKYSNRHRPPPTIDHRGIRATLTKGGSAYDTFVPWSAVVALRETATGTLVHWQVAVPEKDTKDEKPKKKAGHLRLV